MPPTANRPPQSVYTPLHYEMYFFDAMISGLINGDSRVAGIADKKEIESLIPVCSGQLQMGHHPHASIASVANNNRVE